IGRKFDDNKAAEHEWPKVRILVCRSLTPESHGNAIGIGLVDLCPSRLLRQMDPKSTRINALTSGHMSAAKLPIDFETDREVLENALPSIGLTPPEKARLLWIRNSLDVIEAECSAVYLGEARERKDLEVLTDLRPLPFDASGNLPGSVREWGSGM